jgi:uncharacterized membrane protein YqaE (UPF0057 family)
MKKLLLAVLVVGFAISSCSIEKRLHQKGFNVEWNNNLGSLKKDKKEKQDFVSSEAAEEIAVVSHKSTKTTSVNSSSSAISADGASLNESIEASLFVEENTTNEVNSQESSVVNNTKIEKVNRTIITPKASSSKVVASANKTKTSTKMVKKALKNDVPIVLLYILCFFIPFLAVGLATDWDVTAVVINLILSFLFWLPGIIHAIIVVGRNS